MNSFTLTAVGNLARDPELAAKNDTSYTRFCLVGNDYAGKGEEGAAREMVTTLWFVAFGPLGEAIARNARKGDQQYDHSFIVDGFRFGAPGPAKREEFEARRGESAPRVAAGARGVSEP